MFKTCLLIDYFLTNELVQTDCKKKLASCNRIDWSWLTSDPMKTTSYVSPNNFNRFSSHFALPGKENRKSEKLSPTCFKKIPNGFSSMKSGFYFQFS